MTRLENLNNATIKYSQDAGFPYGGSGSIA